MVRRILAKVLLLFWCFAHWMNYCPLYYCLFIFCSHMNFEMIDKIFLMFVSLAALVAPEWSRPCVKKSKRSCEVRWVLKCLVRSDFCLKVLSHWLQLKGLSPVWVLMCSCNWPEASAVALDAFERLFSGVLPNHVFFEMTRSNARILASLNMLHHKFGVIM